MKFMMIFSNFVNNDTRIFMDIELNHYISFVHFFIKLILLITSTGIHYCRISILRKSNIIKNFHIFYGSTSRLDICSQFILL